MPPAKCPYLHRCNKYTDLTCQIDRLREASLAKDREIARLKAENERLKAAQCGGGQTSSKALPFGSSTPSSKIPLKPNSSEESRRRLGGRPKGHEGCGRNAGDESLADERTELPPPTCPVTGKKLAHCQVRERSVLHSVPARVIKKHYTIFRAWCPECGCYHESEVPGVMPHFAFSNDLIAQTLVDHFGNGMPMGMLARRMGVKKSALFNMSHRIAEMLESGTTALLDEFRSAPVKHADETPWSCDGKNGYAWGFFTLDLSIYRLRQTRSGSVAKDVFGDGQHTGVLGVDRYAAYGTAWKGKIQYCLEHYKRNVRDLLEAEPDRKEYKEFIPHFLDLLKEAMTLRKRFKGPQYDTESQRVRDEILKWISEPLKDGRIKDGRLKGYFEYMASNKHRFFQWVRHPEVEAENNLAERRLRPMVIARKVCFGSQSDKGLKTRETLMSVIDTLRLRHADPVRRLSEVFAAVAKDRTENVGDLLWKQTRPQSPYP